MSPSRHEPVHPRGHAGGYPLAPWLIIGTLAAATGLAWLAWAAGQVTGWATGIPRTGPGFGDEFLAALLRGQWQVLWPGLSAGLVAAVWLVLVAAVLVPACWGWAWWRARRPQAGDPLPSLARPADVAELHPTSATRLRPSLAGNRARKLPAPQIGVPVGKLVTTGRRRRLVLHASWEDVLLAVMAPRAGTTAALAVPPILQAPGPVIATSNKTDLWAATTRARVGAGVVWLFDPQRITHTPQTFWWNPLAQVTTVEEASRLSDHFVQEIRTPGVGDMFWPLAAADLLTCLFLAAAHSGGTLAKLQAWLSDATSREPVTLLRVAGFPQAARPARPAKRGTRNPRRRLRNRPHRRPLPGRPSAGQCGTRRRQRAAPPGSHPAPRPAPHAPDSSRRSAAPLAYPRGPPLPLPSPRRPTAATSRRGSPHRWRRGR